jgi:3'(2'), 5'-bisphosphate nucleotidase
MLSDLRIDPLIDLLNSAGRIIMQFYQSGEINIQTKADNSPVTNADHSSNELILSGLSSLYPDTPVISEEMDNSAYDIRKNWDYCWMLDPLDGTKEFIKRNGEFSINLALIHHDKPIAGFIHFPVQGWTYYAIEGKGAFKKVLHHESYPLSDISFQNSFIPKSHLRVMISRSHSGKREQAFINTLKDKGYEVETLAHGSAMKHCLIAEGLGDIYPKFGPCSEWDTAPGQIILQEVGGKITRCDNMKPLSYNKANFENPEFIMWGPGIPSDL